MSQEMDTWLEIAVKPAVEGAKIARLDQHLTQQLPAAVTQHLENGQWSYKPNEQGEYEVRLFVPAFVSFVNVLIQHNAFEVVRAIEMPEGKEIVLSTRKDAPTSY